MKISPSPGRMSLLGHCPAWPSALSSSRACRNPMRCPAFMQDGVMPALERDLPDVAEFREAYRDRAILLSRILAEAPNCRVMPPEGGMFVLLDIRGTGLGAENFARQLLTREHVAVLPCDSFGPSAAGHLRISLTAAEPRLEEAGRRIARFARGLALLREC